MVEDCVNEQLRTIYITSNYGWTQTDTSIILYIPIQDANIIKPNQYTVELKPRSIKFYLNNHQGKNYTFKLSKLCGLIDPHKISVRLKTKKVVIYLTKIETGKQWNDIKTKSVGEVYNQIQRQSQELNVNEGSDKKLLYENGYHSSSKNVLSSQKKELDIFYVPDVTSSTSSSSSSSSTSLSKSHDHHLK
ncbi:unnamed protein product [Cunninghamella blakesleeana]